MKTFAFMTISIVAATLCFSKAMALGLVPSMVMPIVLVVGGCLIIWEMWDDLFLKFEENLQKKAEQLKAANATMEAARTVCQNHPEEFAAALTNS